MKVYRQGDVLFVPIAKKSPLRQHIKKAKAVSRIIQRGENGGRHVLEAGTAKVVRPGFPISSFDSFERTQAFANARGRRYVHVPPGVQARVVHREHKPLTLPSGDFEIRTQREMQGVGTR